MRCCQGSRKGRYRTVDGCAVYIYSLVHSQARAIGIRCARLRQRKEENGKETRNVKEMRKGINEIVRKAVIRLH